MILPGANVFADVHSINEQPARTRFEQTEDEASLATAVAASTDALASFSVDDRAVVMVGYDHAGPDATLPDRLPEHGVRIAGLAWPCVWP